MKKSAPQWEALGAVPKPPTRPLRDSGSFEYVARAASCLFQSTHKEVTIDTPKTTPKYLSCQSFKGSRDFAASRPNRPNVYKACSKIEHCSTRGARIEWDPGRKSRPSSLVAVWRIIESRQPQTGSNNFHRLHSNRDWAMGTNSPAKFNGRLDPMSALPTFFEDWREMFQDLPVVLIAKQLEPILGLNCKTIWAMARKGILPSYRYGSNVRFNKYEILRWLQEHRDGPGQRPVNHNGA